MLVMFCNCNNDVKHIFILLINTTHYYYYSQEGNGQALFAKHNGAEMKFGLANVEM